MAGAAPRRWFEPPAAGTAYFAVVGHPVAPSKSPQIHAAFAAATGRRLHYARVDVLPGALAAAVAEFRACGGVGLNVTVPLKEEAWALAEHRAPRAASAGAANTVWFEADGAIAVDNTDGPGLVRDLEQNHGVHLAGRRLLVLGAGGAARGVMPALLDCAPATIQVSNRSADRAETLVRHFADARLAVLGWGAPPAQPLDVVINATAAGLGGELPALAGAAFGTHTVCYDMMYGAEPTAFLRWAAAAGAGLCVDGLGMLVEQAAVAFAIWHGVAPQTAPVIAALRARTAPD